MDGRPKVVFRRPKKDGRPAEGRLPSAKKRRTDRQRSSSVLSVYGRKTTFGHRSTPLCSLVRRSVVSWICWTYVCQGATESPWRSEYAKECVTIGRRSSSVGRPKVVFRRPKKTVYGRKTTIGHLSGLVSRACAVVGTRATHCVDN